MTNFPLLNTAPVSPSAQTSGTEPVDVGPAVGGHLRASDEDRHRIATLLLAAHDEGRLTREECDLRLEAAWNAVTFDDLVPLSRDLVALPDASATRVLATSSAPSTVVAPVVDPAGSTEPSDTRVGILSASKREGKFRVRRKLSGLAICGEVVYDMREAIFDADVIELDVFCLCGSVKLLVPPGVTVIDNTLAVMGETSVKGLDESVPGPQILVKGFVGMGEVNVRGPQHKSWWKKHS